MTVEYLIAFHDGSIQGRVERESNRDAALSCIEELVQDHGCDLEWVQEIDCSDGQYSARFVTDEFLEHLHRRETERFLEKFLKYEHGFASFTGYLDVQERTFPCRATLHEEGT